MFRSEFFLGTTRVRLFIFFVAQSAIFLSPEFHIWLYDKNSESDYFFFPPPKSEYFFQQHWESEYFFFVEKKQNIALKLDKNFLAVDKDVLYVFHIFHTKNLILITICETDFHDVIEDIIND